MEARKEECPQCEGTGKKLNTFDLPQRDLIRNNSEIEIIPKFVPRSKRGYEILDCDCDECHGSGQVLKFG